MYNVIVPSCEGRVQCGNGWFLRVVWNTWTREASLREAIRIACNLADGQDYKLRSLPPVVKREGEPYPSDTLIPWN
jgi:hypothetical protein